ncbi:uncharacterized protein LOC120479993 [Pimephales promelas]|uniref:uncharacterized protein LOC120479993 n=1 Tax=Pimephales promelas TaxID=90988 RepID=UPI001955E8B8|nr:uncharacterized protein LOC120479993 [Pimephales promelas]
MAIEDCPICFRPYHQLSQHLTNTHLVKNKEERKLLLALSSGRVDVRKGTCPVPACGKTTARMDRHLKCHSELTPSTRKKTLASIKRRKILEDLANLRASNPEVPLASTLDQEDVSGPVEEEEVADAPAPPCANPACLCVRDQLADMHLQVETLSKALQEVTRRYKRLRRRSRSTPSSQVARVTGRLLSALWSPGKGDGGGDDEEEGEAGPSEEPDDGVPQPLSPAQPSPQQERHPFPDHVPALNVLLEEFRGHQQGADPTPRLVHNVGSKIFRIRNFIGFMAAGHTDLASFGFLNQTARMRSWHQSLNQAKIAEPTIQMYLKNVSQFLLYISETPPPTCRLSCTVMVGLNREIKSLIRSVWRRVVVHEVGVNQAKEGHLIPKAALRQCVASARAAIAEILACLKVTLDRKDQWSFYGHLTAYLACIYGHRSGVFQNMTIAEVEAARQATMDGCYVINISTHKTNQAFGAAQMAVTETEYQWMAEFLAMREELVGGGDAHYFFFTSKPSPCKNLNQYFQEAWAGLELPGTPTFTDVRTSIATHAKNTISPGDRHKVARFMCHDTSTAD